MHHPHIAIIGAPLDLGQGRRGVDMGPSAIRVANLNKRLAALGFHPDDLGNVPVDQPESLPEGPDRARYLPQIALACKRLALIVDRALTKKKIPLVLGGDHSVAVGTVAGVSRHFRRKQEIGLIGIDAHADMNTPETSPSGNVQGMPLASCVGLGSPEPARRGRA
jgi:arginase